MNRSLQRARGDRSGLECVSIDLYGLVHGPIGPAIALATFMNIVRNASDFIPIHRTFVGRLRVKFTKDTAI